MHHMAFVEVLSRLEAEGAEREWRETWAGLLVLRLYRLWQLNPETASTVAPGAASVQAVVDHLPESASIKKRLAQILETLRAPTAVHPTAIAELLGNYASGLAQRAQWTLADDVYETAGLPRPTPMLPERRLRPER